MSIPIIWFKFLFKESNLPREEEKQMRCFTTVLAKQNITEDMSFSPHLILVVPNSVIPI